MFGNDGYGVGGVMGFGYDPGGSGPGLSTVQDDPGATEDLTEEQSLGPQTAGGGAKGLRDLKATSLRVPAGLTNGGAEGYAPSTNIDQQSPTATTSYSPTPTSIFQPSLKSQGTATTQQGSRSPSVTKSRPSVGMKAATVASQQEVANESYRREVESVNINTVQDLEEASPQTKADKWAMALASIPQSYRPFVDDLTYTCMQTEEAIGNAEGYADGLAAYAATRLGLDTTKTPDQMIQGLTTYLAQFGPAAPQIQKCGELMLALMVGAGRHDKIPLQAYEMIQDSLLFYTVAQDGTIVALGAGLPADEWATGQATTPAGDLVTSAPSIPSTTDYTASTDGGEFESSEDQLPAVEEPAKGVMGKLKKAIKHPVVPYVVLGTVVVGLLGTLRK